MDDTQTRLDDHDELYQIERFAVSLETIIVKAITGQNKRSVIVFMAHLLTLMELMHCILDEPSNVEALLADWRHKRDRIASHTVTPVQKT